MSLRFALALVAAALAACAPNVGPRTIPAARFDYNQHIDRSWNEQLLLNIVRLRYRDTPFFLEVGTIVSQYEVAGGIAAGTSIGVDDAGTTVDAGADVRVAERPTITYQPLVGEAFVQRLLSPVPPGTVSLLAGSGWSVARILLCCVDAVNDLRNVPAASGPTPAVVQDDPRFREAAEALRMLQRAGHLELVRPTEGTVTGRLRLTPDSLLQPDERRTVARLRELLGLRPGMHDYSLTITPDDTTAAVRIRQRSLLGAMHYLSQAVEVPEAHVTAGLVTTARTPAGDPVDWATVTGSIFRVRVADRRPPRAFTAVRYRGHWFYIDDADLETKTTFGLLSHLFSLQATTPRTGGPVLTVGTGG